MYKEKYKVWYKKQENGAWYTEVFNDEGEAFKRYREIDAYEKEIYSRDIRDGGYVCVDRITKVKY